MKIQKLTHCKDEISRDTCQKSGKRSATEAPLFTFQLYHMQQEQLYNTRKW